MSDVEPFDFIFIDADKEGYPKYLELTLQLSRPGTVIVADNVVRAGEVVNASSTDERVQGVRAFLEMAAANDRIDGTAIQTVGSKGYDGFALLVVTRKRLQVRIRRAVAGGRAHHPPTDSRPRALRASVGDGPSHARTDSREFLLRLPHRLL